MKKKIIVAMFALSALVTLGGCKKVLEFEQQSNSEQASETVTTTASEVIEETETKETETKETEESKETQETKESEESKESEETAEPEEEVEQVKVENNGGFFVEVEDKIYYRAYDSGSFNSNILGNTGFVNGSDGHSSNKIMSVSKKDPAGTPETVIENDNGYGPMYVYGGYIYSTQVDSEFNDSVYRVSLKTKKAEKVADGFILGASPDGKTMLVESYDFSSTQLKTVVAFYQNGKKISEKDMSFASISVNYIAMNDDSAFFFLHDDSDQTSAVVQLTTDGKYIILAEIAPYGDGEAAVPSIKNATVNGDEVSFTLELLAGSGMFVNDIREISVPICKDTSNVSEEGVLYEANVGANLYNEEYSEEVQYPEAIAELEIAYPEADESGYYRTIQKVEEVEGKTYVVVANSVINSIYTIGWRDSYDLISLDYYVYSEIEGLQKIASYPCLDGYVTARAWIVGEKGKKAESLMYQLCEIDGVETEPVYSNYFYNPKFAEDLVYEYPKGDDIYGDWIKGDVKDLLDKVSDASVFLSKATSKLDVYGFESPKINDSERNYMYVHVGFNEKGEVNYIRPVVFD